MKYAIAILIISCVNIIYGLEDAAKDINEDIKNCYSIDLQLASNLRKEYYKLTEEMVKTGSRQTQDLSIDEISAVIKGIQGCIVKPENVQYMPIDNKLVPLLPVFMISPNDTKTGGLLTVFGDGHCELVFNKDSMLAFRSMLYFKEAYLKTKKLPTTDDYLKVGSKPVWDLKDNELNRFRKDINNDNN